MEKAKTFVVVESDNGWIVEHRAYALDGTIDWNDEKAVIDLDIELFLLADIEDWFEKNMPFYLHTDEEVDNYYDNCRWYFYPITEEEYNQFAGVC